MNERSPNPSEHDKPSDATLQRVWLDNVRANQIGGETDGITPDVAADMGYFPPETTKIDATEAEIDAAQDRHPTTYGRTSSGPKKRRIFRGIIRGDSELDTGRPAYYDEFKMTPEEQVKQDEINKRGAQQTREAMRNARRDEQDSPEQN